MQVRVGINGFGRIGKLFFKALWEHPSVQVSLINDPAADAATAAYLLNRDSTHGPWKHHVTAGPDWIAVSGHLIPYHRQKETAANTWGELCDIVVDCSGRIKNEEDGRQFLDIGVKKVIASHPVEGIPNIVLGVNDHSYNPSVHHVICAASCTTNCLAPLIKVMHEGIGIERGTVTTIHAVTNDQSLLDQAHGDLRRARGAFQSLIPTSTGVAKAINGIFPDLAGHLNGLAVRAPVADVSLTDCVVVVRRDTTREEVIQLLETAAHGPMQGILGVEHDPLVSVDFLNDTRSSIVDALSTQVVDKRLVKILSWYDNEVGYSNRLAELTEKVSKSL